MKISVVLPILVPTPFLRAMTEFCIKTLRAHADQPFELVVVEAVHHYFESTGPEHPLHVEKYINFPQKIGQVREINAGVDAATGDLIVFTGNDLIAPPHWDTELRRPFELFRDCGASSISAFEPGARVGPPAAMDLYVEGMYSPFMAFRKGWRYDEAYQRVYQDSDLIMRMYDKGLRAYRSCRVHAHHLLRMTNDNVDKAQHDVILKQDERLFYQRWGKSPLMMFGLIRFGAWGYGHEHESLTNPTPAHEPLKGPI